MKSGVLAIISMMTLFILPLVDFAPSEPTIHTLSGQGFAELDIKYGLEDDVRLQVRGENRKHPVISRVMIRLVVEPIQKPVQALNVPADLLFSDLLITAIKSILNVPSETPDTSAKFYSDFGGRSITKYFDRKMSSLFHTVVDNVPSFGVICRVSKGVFWVATMVLTGRVNITHRFNEHIFTNFKTEVFIPKRRDDTSKTKAYIRRHMPPMEAPEPTVWILHRCTSTRTAASISKCIKDSIRQEYSPDGDLPISNNKDLENWFSVDDVENAKETNASSFAVQSEEHTVIAQYWVQLKLRSPAERY